MSEEPKDKPEIIILVMDGAVVARGLMPVIIKCIEEQDKPEDEEDNK